MNQVQANPGRPAQGAGRSLPSSFMSRLMLLLAWILAWTVIFSAVDFWSIKLYDVCNLSWFQAYRAVMRYGVSWVAPPSFALAENAYFVWMNMYDPDYQMHEWAWYSGNPSNPDGHFNFVWGDGRGGWTKFSMKEWYAVWLFPTALWLFLIILVSKRKQAHLPRDVEGVPALVTLGGLDAALKWPTLPAVQPAPPLDDL